MRAQRPFALTLPVAAAIAVPVVAALAASPVASASSPNARSATQAVDATGTQQPTSRTASSGLPLGDPALPEARTRTAVASGVTLTQIVRGTGEAKPEEFATTQAGPWNVTIVTIDPRRAKGRLISTVGQNVATTEPTSAMAKAVGALAAMNASFFAFTASKEAPGDPYGLSIEAGEILSEPQRGTQAIGMILNSRTGRMTMDSLTWQGRLASLVNRNKLTINGLNRPPIVPFTCVDTTDPASCAVPGEVVAFGARYGKSTPTGPGVEAVVNARGCLVTTRSPRGGPLAAGQRSFQATGQSAQMLTLMLSQGCVRFDQGLKDSRGRTVRVDSSTYGVNGRSILVAGGRRVAQAGGSDFAGRHPRSIVGRTAGGSIVFLTIDGRRPTSVGATLTEASAVAASVGLRDAINLDGGGSTTLVLRGKVINRVSGSSERPVSDALAWINR